MGAPMSGSSSRLMITDLKFIIEEKQATHLEGWQGGSMPLVGRKVLIDASLNSVLIVFV
jgi:hypothetical protein